MSKGKKKDYNKPVLVHKSVKDKIAELKGLKYTPPPNPRKDGKAPVVEFKFEKREGFYRLGAEPGGYVEIPPGIPPFRQEYPGGWDLERLKQLMDGIEPGRIVEEETKNPTDQWVDEWIRDNGKAHSSL